MTQWQNGQIHKLQDHALELYAPQFPQLPHELLKVIPILREVQPVEIAAVPGKQRVARGRIGKGHDPGWAERVIGCGDCCIGGRKVWSRREPRFELRSPDMNGSGAGVLNVSDRTGYSVTCSCGKTCREDKALPLGSDVHYGFNNTVACEWAGVSKDQINCGIA